jgi:uncharacterized membrane protein
MSMVESMCGADVFKTSLCIITIFLACTSFLMKIIPKIPLLNKVTFIPFLSLVPMTLSSVGVIPSNYPLYKPLQAVSLYMAIFFMIMAIDVGKVLRSLQPRILALFLLGCAGTALGAALAQVLSAPLIGAENSAMISACTAGSYAGGAMNWAAVGDALDMPSSLNAMAFPASVIAYTLYLGLVLTLDNSPLRPALERWIGVTNDLGKSTASVTRVSKTEDSGALKLEDYINGFLAFCVVFIVSIMLEQLVRGLVFVPLVIFLTTFAIMLGAIIPSTKVDGIKRLRKMSSFGEASLFFLLCVIGAQAKLTSSLIHAPALLLIPAVVIAVHVFVLLLFARLLKVDLVTSAIVSIAAIGGVATAPVTAAALKAVELIPLAILLGMLGYAVGTYMGVYLGVFLLP